MTITLTGGIHVEESVTISKPPEVVYRFWRDFENIPKFMRHVQSIRVLSTTLSHWVVQGPLGQVEWDAEIINEKENELIAWESVQGSDMRHAGSVRFLPLDWGRQTEVHVSFNYEPIAGPLNALITKLFDHAPEEHIQEDLARLRQLLETGELATIEGQPRGECR